MPVQTKTESSSSSVETSPRSESSVQIDPNKVRMVALVVETTGEVVRRECYDFDGGTKVEGVMRVKDGELWLRTINWARSESMDDEVEIRWTPTGYAPESISRVSVFSWPVRELIRVFEK